MAATPLLLAMSMSLAGCTEAGAGHGISRAGWPGASPGWKGPAQRVRFGEPDWLSEGEFRSLIVGNTLHLTPTDSSRRSGHQMWHIGERGATKFTEVSGTGGDGLHEHGPYHFENGALCGVEVARICLRARREPNGTMILSKVMSGRIPYSPRWDMYAVSRIERGDPNRLVERTTARHQRVARDIEKLRPYIIENTLSFPQRAAETNERFRQDREEYCRYNPRQC